MINIKKLNITFIILILVSFMTISYLTLLGGSKYEINSMSEDLLFDKLTTLSQIGEHRANLIIDNRPYDKLQDVTTINGIGEETYLKVKKYFRVGGVIK